MALASWALTTLADAKSFLGLSTSAFDAQLEACIDEVSARMEIYCARHLKSAVFQKVTSPASDNRLRLDGNNRTQLRLPEYPVTALAAAAYLEDGVETSINVTNATIDGEAGIITLSEDYFPFGSQNIIISCTAGYVPGTHDRELVVLRRACHLWLGTWWLEQKNAISGAIEVEGVKLPTDDPPQRVADIIDSFVYRCWA